MSKTLKTLFFLATLILGRGARANFEIGTQVYFFNSGMASARLNDNRGSKTGPQLIYIPQRSLAKILTAREFAGTQIFELELKYRDARGICGQAGALLSLRVEASRDLLSVDGGKSVYQKELEKTFAQIKATNPRLDFSALEKSFQREPFLEFLEEPNDPGQRINKMLIHTCGDPGRIQESEKISAETFAVDLSAAERQKLSADFPVLAEISNAVNLLNIKTTKEYQEHLKSRGAKNESQLKSLRQLISNLVETSEIEEPPIRDRRLIRRAFSSTLAQQLILEEVARRFVFSLSLNQRNLQKPACDLLVRALHLFQHVDGDVAPFAFETSNSVLLLYSIVDGARFETHGCSLEINKLFGPYGSAMPYGLPSISNPGAFSQRTMTRTFLLIPIHTEKLYPEEWAADFPQLGRIVMENPNLESPSISRYFWKGKNPQEPDRQKNSEALIKLWSRRALN